MHSHRRRTLRTHVTHEGLPIRTSVICCCCEDHAGNRMASWHAAVQGVGYDGGPRQALAEGVCAFCGRRVKAPR